MVPDSLVCACSSRELNGATQWPRPFDTLRSSTFPWLLESTLTTSERGRYSFAGADPYLVLSATGRRIEIQVRREARPDLDLGRTVRDGDPFQVLRDLLPPAPLDKDFLPLPFVGGAVGTFGYELAEQIEAVQFRSADLLETPDLLLLFVDRLLAFDHRTGCLRALGLGFGTGETEARQHAEAAAADLEERILASEGDRNEGGEPKIPSPPGNATLRSHFDLKKYERCVERIQERILDGDVYQANLTQRLEVDWKGDPWLLYERLRRTNPAPFACYLELPGVTVVGNSPERFLRVDTDGAIESRPIKGTRPRRVAPEDDEQERKALECSEKDRAENLMIVDLVRNDLGRVCATGSIHVPELMEIEAYATVFHMVSSVRGQLRSDRDALDAIRAAFPPGSMTGAPKIAAMKILAALEPVRRGVYSGALGYLDVRGGADLAVVIRTILISGDRAHVHVGGAVVADSDPAAEYQESMDKARALLDALGVDGYG